MQTGRPENLLMECRKRGKNNFIAYIWAPAVGIIVVAICFCLWFDCHTTHTNTHHTHITYTLACPICLRVFISFYYFFSFAVNELVDHFQIQPATAPDLPPILHTRPWPLTPRLPLELPPATPPNGLYPFPKSLPLNRYRNHCWLCTIFVGYYFHFVFPFRRRYFGNG